MSKKLHILFLCGWYPSKVNPTNGDFIQRHAEAVTLENTVSVLHVVTDKNYSQNIEYSFEIINGVKTHIAYVKATKNPFLKGILFLKAFKTILSKINSIDLVHLNVLYPFGLFALYLKWFKKKKYIITEHWTRYLYPQVNDISFIEKNISKLICKNAFLICPVSTELEDSMLKNKFKGNYQKIGNVVDTSLFTPKKKTNTVFNLLHVSSLLDHHKNISGMLKVAKQLENKIGEFTWKFVGGKQDQYQELINTLNFSKAKIEFINHVPQEILVTYLQEADIYISFSNYETFGIVMAEALSCGVPVISTNTGILNELEQNEEFYKIISIKDKVALLEEIENFKQASKKGDQLKMHDFIVKNYSKKAISNQFSEIYHKSLKA
ncbi:MULTISPECIES: glycosyltransferase family 4 protein [Tenacibaculum]|uniref:glycosyltransferase family 4 protein n=1 Tax=Tenacibaculum TaxID=104267 RepID=UPI001F0AB607|nr:MULTISPECIES: glycosyltransferase family 4 protein [Tenacibaculum]MCH3880852.1 glycosyltransferase family 4 protein [Tenacibaculum aquimarinum]MDO6599549.1 glycosyltransferase family 4 protein [Tenacibaculum sp. 1_MG-2023]